MIGTTMNLSAVNFKRYMFAQVKYFNDAKYFEGINTHNDPGDGFIEVFVCQKSVLFRESWNRSQCSKCCKDCGDLLKEYCDNFKPLEDIDESE